MTIWRIIERDFERLTVTFEKKCGPEWGSSSIFHKVSVRSPGALEMFAVGMHGCVEDGQTVDVDGDGNTL